MSTRTMPLSRSSVHYQNGRFNSLNKAVQGRTIICHNSAVSSKFRIAASRANGAKSRGPVTDEGKRIAALNTIHSPGLSRPRANSASRRTPSVTASSPIRSSPKANPKPGSVRCWLPSEPNSSPNTGSNKRKGRCPAPPGHGRNTHFGGADATRLRAFPGRPGRNHGRSPMASHAPLEHRKGYKRQWLRSTGS